MASSPSFMLTEELKNYYKKLGILDMKKVEGSEEILSFWMTYLTPAIIEEARTELHETDEIREKSISQLRKLVENEKNLVTPTDDLFLLAFLRARKFDIKKAFKLFQKFWSFRKEHSEIYGSADPDLILQIIRHNFTGYLPYRDRKGAIVMIHKVGKWNPEMDNQDNILRTMTVFLMYAIRFPVSQITGFRVIFDLRGMSWIQMKYMTPSNMMLLVRSTQFCFPARFKGIHVISENKLFRICWSVVYPFLTAKLKERVLFHGEDLQQLQEYIHPSVLPVEYGGKAPEFENSEWESVANAHTHEFLDMTHWGYQD